MELGEKLKFNCMAFPGIFSLANYQTIRILPWMVKMVTQESSKLSEMKLQLSSVYVVSLCNHKSHTYMLPS